MNNLASLFSSMFTRRLVRFNSLILRFDEVRFFFFFFENRILRSREFFSETAVKNISVFRKNWRSIIFVWCAYILGKRKRKKFRWNNNLGESDFSFFLDCRFRSIAIKEFRFLEKVDFQDFFRNFLEFYKKYKIFYKSVMMAIFEFTYYVKLRKIISIFSRLIDFQTFI